MKKCLLVFLGICLVIGLITSCPHTAINGGNGGAAPVPSQVTGLNASKGTGLSEIDLYWNAAQNAVKYYVYQSSSATGTYSKMSGETSSTAATITSVPQGTHFFFKVAGVNEDNIEGSLSDYAEGWTGLPAPSDLTASQGDYSDYIALNWSSVTNAAYYSVYASTSSGGSYSYVGDDSSTSVDYYTSDPIHLFFKVSAVDSHDEEGPLSSYAEGWIIPTETILWEPDGSGFIQFYTNDPQYYDYLFWATISGSYMGTTGDECIVQTKKISGYAYGSYGIVFSYYDSNNFFVLLITTQGSYAIYQIYAGDPYELQGWTSSGYLYTGYNTINTLKTIYYYNLGGYDYQDLYLNGNNIGSIYNSPGTLDGYVGFFASVTGSSYENFPSVPVDVRFKMTSPVIVPSLVSTMELPILGLAEKTTLSGAEQPKESTGPFKLRAIRP